MGIPLRRQIGRVFPKSLRPAIKSQLFSLASRRFHGIPRARVSLVEAGDTATLSIDNTSVILAQPFADVSIWWLQEHPEDLLEVTVLLKLAAAVDGVMLDIGAHVGMFAALFCTASAHDVLCFEPVAASQKAIEETAALNGFGDRIQVVVAAVGDRVGVTSMHLDAATGFAQAQNYESSPVSSSEQIVVQTTTVDAIRQTTDKKVGLLKIDVEGFEAEVLEGATQTLLGDQPVVAIEIHNDYLSERGVSLSRMLTKLEDHGYRLMQLNGRATSASAAARTFLPRAHLLAVPKARQLHYQQLLQT